MDPIDFLESVLNFCYANQISSLIVEGGTNTIYQFMNKNKWDEARVFVNTNKTFEHGIISPEINLSTTNPVEIGSDLFYTILNN